MGVASDTLFHIYKYGTLVTMQGFRDKEQGKSRKQ